MKMNFRICLTIAVSVPLVYTQRIMEEYPPGGPNWDNRESGHEDRFMQFTSDWKKEIVAWGKECIFEIKNKIYQVDQINWAAQDDIRFQIGQTIGRILELHRQQEDMYRRFKRRMENRFNWIHPMLGIAIPQLQVEGNLEPKPSNYTFPKIQYPWKQYEQNHVDYKPNVYILALEFVTKKESDIEHLVKLITNFMSEEEVGRFKPHWLPADEDGLGVWQGFSTVVTIEMGKRPGPGRRAEEAAERKEEAFKSKMRAEYYRKRNGRH